jgi:UDP-glucose 4-epimerase
VNLRLAITGCGGYLARDLIARLGSDPDCQFILGLDIRPRPVRVKCQVQFLEFDVATKAENLAALLLTWRVNAAVHLAWQFNPIHDRARHREVDVEGSRSFFSAVEAAKLKRVVYASSTTAYVNSANPSESAFLTERTVVSGTPRYLYSKHKAEVDWIAQQFMERHPQVQVIVLRPAIVLGPNTQNIVTKMFEWPFRAFPWTFQVRGADPQMQFISEEDMGAILYRAVKSEMSGIYNVAADGLLRYSELARLVGKRPLKIPATLLYPATAALWLLRLAPFPAGILDLIRYPWVADNTKLKKLFGYTPRHTSRQALDTFLAAQRASR